MNLQKCTGFFVSDRFGRKVSLRLGIINAALADL